MRKLAVFLAAIAPCGAFAQSDFAVTWDILGGLEIGYTDYATLELDIDIGSRYYSVNGGMKDSIGIISPVTGTCFDSAIGGIYCILQVDQYSFNLNVSSNLNGTLVGKGALGDEISSSSVLFKSVE